MAPKQAVCKVVRRKLAAGYSLGHNSFYPAFFDWL